MFICNKDTMSIVGCSSSTASRIKRTVLDYSDKRGILSVGSNRCLAKDLCTLYG